MSALGAKMRMTAVGPAVWCPGCQRAHVFNAADSPTSCGAKWAWDGNVERPTFLPSMVVRIGDGIKPGGEARNRDDWVYKTVCHSFVRSGRMEFLSDCDHSLAGKTVDLPDWPIGRSAE